MAEEAVLTAPVDAGAGGGSPDAGAGGGSGAPAAVETPVSQQTDEQILGMDPVGTPLKDKPAEKVADPAAQVDPNADPNAAKTPEQLAAEKIAEDGRLMPVKWREMAKNDPEFRTLFYTAKANAEKLATIEPQFTEFKAKVEAVDKADQAYLSGDPAAIQSELQTFVGNKPQTLLPMLQSGEKLLEQLLPQEYSRIQTERFTAGLRANNFGNVFQVLRNAREAGESGREVLEKQIDMMLEFADKNGFPTTEAAKLQAQKTELDARETANRQADERSYNQTAETFRTGVNESIQTTIKTEIKTSLDKLLEKAAFTEGARARIASEVQAAVNDKLSQNRDIVLQIGNAIWPNGSKNKDGQLIRGNWSDANKKLAVDLPVNYAKSVLADTIKAVVENYTKDFMAANTNRETKAAAAGAKTEISGGASQRSSKPLTKKDVDYSKMSDDDILAA